MALEEQILETLSSSLHCMLKDQFELIKMKWWNHNYSSYNLNFQYSITNNNNFSPPDHLQKECKPNKHPQGQTYLDASVAYIVGDHP